jgi:hypothetical protein
MALIKKTLKEIDCSVIYTTIPELVKETGVSKSSVHYHIKEDTIDGIKIPGHAHNIFISPENADRFKALVTAGIIRTVI